MRDRAPSGACGWWLRWACQRWARPHHDHARPSSGERVGSGSATTGDPIGARSDGDPSRPGARPADDEGALGAGAAQPRPPRPGAVAGPGDALAVEAPNPAPHGGGVRAEKLGDGGRCEDVRWGQTCDGLVNRSSSSQDQGAAPASPPTLGHHRHRCLRDRRSSKHQPRLEAILLCDWLAAEDRSGAHGG